MAPRDMKSGKDICKRRNPEKKRNEKSIPARYFIVRDRSSVEYVVHDCGGERYGVV